MDDRYLNISAIQHYSYCPRQFALIHIEQVWEENFFTADGCRLHERVDSNIREHRRGIQFEYSVLLTSHRLLLNGKTDLLEIHDGVPPRYCPVEYKRGKPKLEEWDRIQLCAQVLCVEEMRDVAIEEGYLFYWQTRHRERVEMNNFLREKTINTINAAHKLLNQGITPKPIKDKRRCHACSFLEICQPMCFQNDYSETYLEEIFTDEKIT
jgi:CRISPR-associated exonuclease Cas4